MDHDIPADLADYLVELDEFIESEIRHPVRIHQDQTGPRHGSRHDPIVEPQIHGLGQAREKREFSPHQPQGRSRHGHGEFLVL
jgi:hypothetical protein